MTGIIAVAPEGLWPALARPDAGQRAPAPAIGWKRIFAFIFLMRGRIKIFAPVIAMTEGTDAALRRRLAMRAFLFSLATILIPTSIGRRMLSNLAIPIQVAALTGGLILFRVAREHVLRQSAGPCRSVPPAPPTLAPTLALAFVPLALPTIITPYGAAAVMIFTAIAPDVGTSRPVFGLVRVVLVRDWLAIPVAHTVVCWRGPLLQLFGVVPGVTQVALGLQVILRSPGNLGVFQLQGISP